MSLKLDLVDPPLPILRAYWVMSTNNLAFLSALVAHNNKQSDVINTLIASMPLQDLFETGVDTLVTIAMRNVDSREVGDRVHFAAARMQDFRLHATELEADGSFSTQVESHLRLSEALAVTDFGTSPVGVKMKQVSTPTLVASFFLAANLIAQDFGDHSDVNLTYAAMIEDMRNDVTS